MWKKEEFKEIETIIGPSVRLEGHFLSQGNVRIAGALSGSLQTQGEVKIDQGSQVNANIIASKVVVGGEVQGDIKAAESIELLNSAKVAGNLETKVLSIAPGAIFNGKCLMKNGLKKGESTSKKTAAEGEATLAE